MYFLHFFIALDQLMNAVLGGAADETLSSRAYRAHRDGKIFGKVFCPLIDMLFFWEEKHCHKAYLDEVYRKQLSKNFK